jgi:DNA mismatch endonuclease, patch repair protein
MKANSGRNTAPELRLRSLLHAAGLRYRVHLPIRIDSGRPISVDIAFPRWKVAVFVDGCFWHGCQVHRTVPRANGSYWGPKLVRNAERDQETVRRLESAGWTAVRFWEHDDPHKAVDRIAATLADKG